MRRELPFRGWGPHAPQRGPRPPGSTPGRATAHGFSLVGRLLAPTRMSATLAPRTPLPPRPVKTSAAVDTTYRLLAALVDRDRAGAEAVLDPSACVWWSQSGVLSAVEGAEDAARRLMALLDEQPPTRLAVVGSSPDTVVTSAYFEDDLCWTLEMRVERARVVGVLLRARRLAA